jgi:hydroxymethylbilane synthase
MRIGTRRSALAMAQAGEVARMIGDAELVPIATRGDRLADGGDKSRWVAELEQALLDGSIDIAVHSAKDVPGELAAGLELVATPARAAAEDALCGVPGLDALPRGARVGTSSLRRMAQLRAAREDIEVVTVHGNVDTRLRKLADRDQDVAAIVLARAGLQRLGREQEAGAVLDPERFVPAPGQGALALQTRGDNGPAREAAQRVGDPSTLSCLSAERALARGLGASCNTPLGAHARPSADGLLLRAWVGLADGSAWLLDELTGDAEEPDALGARVAERMLAAGAGELLRRAETVDSPS